MNQNQIPVVRTLASLEAPPEMGAIERSRCKQDPWTPSLLMF